VRELRRIGRVHHGYLGAPLLSTVLKSTLVLNEPPPKVALLGIGNGTASYCVSFFVIDFADIPLAQSDAFKQVLSCASRACDAARRR
jgi:hypothetical protein